MAMSEPSWTSRPCEELKYGSEKSTFFARAGVIVVAAIARSNWPPPPAGSGRTAASSICVSRPILSATALIRSMSKPS